LAYRDCLRLMRKVGVDEAKACCGCRWLAAPGWHPHAMPAWPAPLACAGWPADGQGLGWRDKWQLARALQALKWRRWQLAEDMTVAHWLQAQRQSDWLVEQFWRPMVLSALNTPLELASMQVLATTCVTAWAEAVPIATCCCRGWICPNCFRRRPCAGCVLAALSGSRAAGCPASCRQRMVCWWMERFDAAIVAVAPYHAGALLQDGTADAGQGFPLLADIYRISALRRRYQHAVAHAGFAGRHAGLAV
jgi:hypothetical protein